MARISDRNSKKHRECGMIDDDAPEPDTVEQNLFIQELARKQTSTSTTLEEQLRLKQSFIKSSADELSVAQFPSGESSLAKFNAKSLHLEVVDFLQSRGLCKEDIDFFFDLKKGRDFLTTKYSKIDPLALERRISELFRRIKTERSQNEMPVFYPPRHPIHQLGDLEESLFGHLKAELIPTSIKEKEPKIPSSKRKQGDSEQRISYLKEGCSQWDQKKAKKYIDVSPKVETVVKTCSPQTWYTIQNGKTVFVGRERPAQVEEASSLSKDKDQMLGISFVAPNQSSLVPMELIMNSRLCDSEIKKIPRFENYERGTVSNTLYLKNLPTSTTENDLVQIFGNFERQEGPALVYRLMGGRMKGQAFITFPDESGAEKALDCVNGFDLKGKQIIIQYGKKPK